MLILVFDVVHVATNWMGDCVLVIMWKKFELICISLDMGPIGVHVGCISCSYKCALFILVNWPHSGLLNNIQMTSCELNTLVDLGIFHLHIFHHVLHNFQHKVQLTYFSLPEPLSVVLLWSLHHFVIEMIEDMYHDVYLLHAIWINPFCFKGKLIHYVFALFHSCKINMEILNNLVMYKNINYLWYPHMIAIV